ILECFEYSNPESLYPSDGKYFYRGGNADWGIIIKEYDISRKLKVVDLKTKTCTDYTSYDVHRIFSDIHNTGIKKVLLCGPAVSGKTTTLYRIAYNLIKENILCLVFKQQANYKRGILKDVNQQIHSGFVVFIDNLTINIGEIHKMIEEATENNIPITFCMATRFSEWQNSVNEFNKAKLEPVNYQVEMEDFIEEIECEKLLSKLSEINLVTISNKAEKSAMIKKFSTSKNLIKILLEIIDRSNISKSICSEYEDLSPEAKMAYGLVSQTYQYDLMIKWEVLRRAIEKKFIFEWDDFIKKIFKGDARGNLFEEFLQGNHFIRGRHRYISKFIIDIHYKGSFKNEKEDILSLISAVTENPYEERFIGSVLNAIISDDERNLTNNDCYEILDAAIDKFYNSKNIAFIIHLKGELFLKERLYKDALKCFDTNVQNKENLPHSLHSLGKTYFYLAQDKELNSGEFRNSINTALEKLFEGLELFRYNEFYYSMIISIFKYLKQHDKFSDLDRKREMKFEERAKIGIGIDKYKELLDAK
uniref:P-loop NTPase n=1 Tax=Ruminiclostridium josui TaxID=1499 RepID=UPI001331B31F